MAQLKDAELIDNALQDGYVTVHDYRDAHLPDLLNEKPVDGWFQYDYVLDLAEGTEKQYMIFG